MQCLHSPLHIARNIYYWNLERFAHVVVEVPEGTTKAIAKRTGKEGGRSVPWGLVRWIHMAKILGILGFVAIMSGWSVPVRALVALAVFTIDHWLR